MLRRTTFPDGALGVSTIEEEPGDREPLVRRLTDGESAWSPSPDQWMCEGPTPYRSRRATYLPSWCAWSSTTVVPAGATDLAIGIGVVYRVGQSIYTIRAGHPRLLWRAQVTPIGLSLEGRRVAWAVNIKGRGHIVALTLPR
jgi:hypothetical protein